MVLSLGEVVWATAASKCHRQHACNHGIEWQNQGCSVVLGTPQTQRKGPETRREKWVHQGRGVSQSEYCVGILEVSEIENRTRELSESSTSNLRSHNLLLRSHGTCSPRAAPRRSLYFRSDATRPLTSCPGVCLGSWYCGLLARATTDPRRRPAAMGNCSSCLGGPHRDVYDEVYFRQRSSHTAQLTRPRPAGRGSPALRRDDGNALRQLRRAARQRARRPPRGPTGDRGPPESSGADVRVRVIPARDGGGRVC